MSGSRHNDLVILSKQAASLSTELYAVQEESQHETTAEEISTIADELSRLSTTLWHLHVAINAEPDQYTEAFQEDLTEITIELISVFEEISECCAGLTMASVNMSAVSWFFKKGRVARLLKHLEALKGTCVVMRTVLWHGRSYGTHTSDRCAEADPHTMHEDRVILESVLAQNREAILDLHNLTNMFSRNEGNQIERVISRGEDHHRELSESTGVEVLPLQDVLPPSKTVPKSEIEILPSSKLDRTFSKRGARLGVHMAILDLSAHEAPVGLKMKWIQQAHLRKQLNYDQHGKGGLTALPELSRISEVDTNTGSNKSLQAHHGGVESIVPVVPENPGIDTSQMTPEILYNTPSGGNTYEMNKSSTHQMLNGSVVGSRLRKMISKISLSNPRSPTRTKDQLRQGEDTAISVSTSDREIPQYLSGSFNWSPFTARTKSGTAIEMRRKSFLGSLRRRFHHGSTDTADIEKELGNGKF